MAGSMSQDDLVADLKSSLNDAAAVFTSPIDADFIRHLDHAALDFGRVRPRVRSGSVTLVADQDSYAAPADAIDEHSLQWGRNKKRDLKPWDNNFPGALPRLDIIGDPGARELLFNPAPSLHQINILGSTCPFRYFAAHKIDANGNTTIQPEDRALLLLRAQAEAAKEMATRNMHKPVSMRDGISGGRMTGTPNALFKQLMDMFEAQAK